MFCKLIALFHPTLLSFGKFLTTWKYMAITSTIAYFFTAFRVQFEKDHRIDFDLAWPIIMFVVFELLVQLVGCIKGKYKIIQSLDDFMVKIILYWIYIKVVDKLCYAPAFAFAGNSLLWAVLLHQSLRIRTAIATVFPDMLPKFIEEMTFEKLKNIFKK